MEPSGGSTAGKRRAASSSSGNHKRQLLATAQKKMADQDKKHLLQRLIEMRGEEEGFDGGWGEYKLSTLKRIPTDGTFVFPAHIFGNAMMDVIRRRNRTNAEFDAGVLMKAYMTGYRVWFSCGREPRDETDTSLFELTQNGDNSSAQSAFVKVDDALVTSRAYIAFGLRSMITAQLLARKHPINDPEKPNEERVYRRPNPRRQAVASSPAAFEKAVVVVEEQLERTPLIPVDRYGARLDFFKRPRDWHRFNTKRSMREDVCERLKNGTMFAVGPSTDDEGRPKFRPLETTCGDPSRQFDKLIASIDFQKLLAMRLKEDTSVLPELVFVARGTFNSVWSFARDADPTKPPLNFPKELFINVNPQETILRVQTVTKDNRDLLPEQEAVEQMTNMVEAAIGEYGPAIHGIAFTRMAYHISWQGEKARYRVYTLMARARFDLERSLRTIFRPPGIPDETHIRRVFTSLHDTIWRYSVDHFVFIDAKLTNFVDFNSGTDHKVRAIDLDYIGFRPISAPVAEGMTQAWRPIWLYNVLNMSVQLRMRVPTEHYVNFWWDRIKLAVKQILQDIQDDDAFGHDDEEFRRAAAFVRLAEWKGDLLVGSVDLNLEYRPKPMPKVKNLNEPEQMATQVVNIAKYYFVAAWFDRAYNVYVRSVREAFRRFPFGEVRRLAIEQCHARYVDEFKDALPMIRHFKEQATLQTPRLLVKVMFSYANMREDALVDRYMDKSEAWPRWPVPNPVLTGPQANSTDYWQSQLGLEFK